MRWIVNMIARLGDYLMGMSPRARTRLALVGILLLAGASVHKLYVSVNELGKPKPAVSAEQLILPMESLFQPTKEEIQAGQNQRGHLDSLAEKINPDLTPTSR